MSDSLNRFLFENLAVRGELVHLDATWRTALQHHDYPAPVRDLLGQMMAAAALLGATIKFQGSITIQLQGNGPVSLAVVECTSLGTLRGVAHWQGEVPERGLREQAGDGRLAITIDPGAGRERYQGIVPLDGDTLAAAIDHYLQRSEQLDTQIWLVADRTRVAGLLLQRLPDERAEQEDWERITLLGGTITNRELLELPAEQVIHRLFHEEDVRLFEAQPLSFRCSCSREKVARMLQNLGREEVDSIIADEGTIEVSCEFCNHHYRFDAVDAQQLFAEGVQPEVGATRH